MSLTISQWSQMYADLLAEHRLLLAEHRKLLVVLRSTPAYTHGNGSPLYYSEEQQDELDNTRLAPPVPNPFEDLRQDEQILASLGLDPNVDYA